MSEDGPGSAGDSSNSGVSQGTPALVFQVQDGKRSAELADTFTCLLSNWHASSNRNFFPTTKFRNEFVTWVHTKHNGQISSATVM